MWTRTPFTTRWSSTATNPLAYSADGNGDGTVDTLKVAHWIGMDWEVDTADEGATSLLGYDPVSGNPAWRIERHCRRTGFQMRTALTGAFLKTSIRRDLGHRPSLISTERHGLRWLQRSGVAPRAARSRHRRLVRRPSILLRLEPPGVAKAGRFLSCLAYRGPVSMAAT
jgi:hypothetical protein